MILCAKFVEIGPLCCLEKICTSCMYQCISYKLFPLFRKKGVILPLNKLESTLPNDGSCAKSSWNGQVNEEFSKVLNQFSLCQYYFSLEKEISLQLNKFKFPFRKKALRQICLILTQLFWGRKRKCEKQYRMCIFGWNCNCYLAIVFCWEKVYTVIWTNLVSKCHQYNYFHYVATSLGWKMV